MSSDSSRQWARDTFDVRPDHWKRYVLAARYSVGKVLDAACGCGYGSKILLENAELVVGVDASKDAIDWANKYFKGPSFIHGRIEDVTGRFETVVSLETIEHIEDPQSALKALRKVCVGTLIASVPNEDRYPFVATNFAKDESPHVRHYRPEEFEGLLKDCGFRVSERFCQQDKQGDIHAGSDGMFMVYVAE